MSDFYPQGYQPKEDANDYVKLTEGEHRFRIMSKPTIGYEFWYTEGDGRLPVRVKTFNEAVKDERASEGIKEFHAFIVWDYEVGMIRLLNVTQKTLQRSIFTYASDEDWGNPTKYDIVIKREGKGLNDTTYDLSVKPSKPAPKEATDALKAVTIDMELYFQGGHPIIRGERSEESDTVLTSEEVEDINSSIPF